MFKSEALQEKTNEYMQKCHQTHHKPSYRGLGEALNISGQTISNVCRGKYNNIPYGLIPNHARCIDNKDFEYIQNVFDGKKYTVRGKGNRKQGESNPHTEQLTRKKGKTI